METAKSTIKVLKILLKDFSTKKTITSLAKETIMSRVGIWKVLKKLESDKLIILSAIGTGRTSIYSVSLNWKNPILEKVFAVALTEESLKNQRWLSNFKELEAKVDFLVIYGSILHFPKEANDIDVIGVAKKNKFLEIEKIMSNIQKTQLKRIHALNFTRDEFKKELEKPNKAFVDSIKKGIILFGQENFIRFMKNIKNG